MLTSMNKDLSQISETCSEKFSLATLIYARLRRAMSRVIDVKYLSENDVYAQYVIDLALNTTDQELKSLATRLQRLIPQLKTQDLLNQELLKQDSVQDSPQDMIKVEPTNEDIQREQVSHRYIGALR